jgi:hypothetical protein
MGRPVAGRSVAVFACPLTCNPLPVGCGDLAGALLRPTALGDLPAGDPLDAR